MDQPKAPVGNCLPRVRGLKDCINPTVEGILGLPRYAGIEGGYDVNQKKSKGLPRDAGIEGLHQRMRVVPFCLPRAAGIAGNHHFSYKNHCHISSAHNILKIASNAYQA